MHDRRAIALFLIIPLILLFLLLLLLTMQGTRDLMTPDEALRADYGPEGIYAGQHQFHDYWARDSFFASWGALALGDDVVVQQNLDLFRSHQLSDGQLPLRIGQEHMLPKLLGFDDDEEVPVYAEDKQGHTSLDQNCLYVVTAGMYLERHPEEQDAWLPSMQLAQAWLVQQDTDEDNLVEEQAYGGWTDSLRKSGEVLYTNVCYYASAQTLAQLDPDYAQEAAAIKASINDQFWLEDGYYADFIDEDKTSTIFSTEANLLVIHWGIASASQAASIEAHIDTAGLRSAAGILDADRPYPLRLKSLGLVLAGMGDYHDGLYWPWISSLDAIVLHDLGREAEARQVLEQQTELYRIYMMVFEVYDQDDSPVERLFYSAEYPFAWNAGMYVYAASVLNN